MSERDMQTLLALVEKHLGTGWIDIVEWLRTQNDLDSIEERLKRFDYTGAVADVEAAARKFAADIQEGYVTAGQTMSSWLDGKVTDKLIRFDQVNPHVIARAKANELELVSGFQEEQNQIARQITQRALIEGGASGVNPRQMAREFRDAIGLAPPQEAAVASYRRALESGDYTNALGRELRDARFDRTLIGARGAGTALDPAYVDKLVENYRQSFIAHRAETIARTESLRHTHEGADEAMRQAIVRGDIAADELESEWNPGPSTKDARAQHHASELTDQRPKYGEPFIMPDGTRMMGPGDPAGGAKHCANCRCCKSTRMVA